MMQQCEMQQVAATVIVYRRYTKGPPNQQDAAVQMNGLDIRNGNILSA